MARTESTMLELGTVAPVFSLPDPVSGRNVSLDDFNGSKGYLVAFICNHCPFVHLIREEFARFAQEYKDKGLAIVAINANDVTAHPDDGPEKMCDEVREQGYVFPYLYDETQHTAKTYRAACTPDFFLFDANRKLVYRGQFDDARPGGSTPVTGRDLRAAADAVIAGRPVPSTQKPSIGCNIKWKPGNEPDYFG